MTSRTRRAPRRSASRARSAAASLALALGCHPADDIVARLASDDASERGMSDAGVSYADDAGAQAPKCCDDAQPPPAPSDAGIAPAPSACAAAAQAMIFLTKGGVLYRVQPEKAHAEELGTPGCLTPSAFVAAVDMDGLVWVVPDDGVVRVIDPLTLACRQLALKMKPSAMAFVYDPALEQQLLYAVEAGTLIALNPATLARVPVSALSEQVQFLVGSADGSLSALTQMPGSVVTIGSVGVGDASVTWRWKAAHPTGAVFQGAAGWGGDFMLIFERDLYRSARDNAAPQLVGRLLADDPGLMTVSSSPCAASAK